MKINEKILSLPPYLSTAWQNVSMISFNSDNQLEISLVNGKTVTIPLLEKKIIDLIFFYHTQSIESKEVQLETQKVNAPSKKENEKLNFSFGLPFPMDNLLPFGQVLQHQPEASHMPDIPKEVLEKVSSFAKTISKDTGQVLFPDVQPHCNCVYCQIGRSVNQQFSVEEEKHEEELVSDEDLKFKEWDIQKTASSLYEVKNPLDQSQVYQVFLGEPIGCTCGRNDCEHIKAVLNTEI